MYQIILFMKKLILAYGPGEQTGQTHAGDDDMGCFVVAVCGTDSPLVKSLRKWRDEQRINGTRWVKFIDFYYESIGYQGALVLKTYPRLNGFARLIARIFHHVVK